MTRVCLGALLKPVTGGRVTASSRSISESPAAFRRCVGASRQVISRAIQTRRLNASVRRLDGRWLIDVATGLREWAANASKLPPEKARGRSTILVPRDQFSVSVWDDVILLARVRADGEPLYLMPMARQTAVALASALLELAETMTAKGRETERKDTMTRNSRAPVAGPTVEPVTKP